MCLREQTDRQTRQTDSGVALTNTKRSLPCNSCMKQKGDQQMKVSSEAKLSLSNENKLLDKRTIYLSAPLVCSSVDTQEKKYYPCENPVSPTCRTPCIRSSGGDSCVIGIQVTSSKPNNISVFLSVYPVGYEEIHCEKHCKTLPGMT